MSASSIIGGAGREVATFLNKMARYADTAATHSLDIGVEGTVQSQFKALTVSDRALTALNSPFSKVTRLPDMPGGDEALKHVRAAVDQLNGGQAILRERHGMPSIVDGFDLNVDAASTAAIPFRSAATSLREAADLIDLRGLLG